MSSTLLNIQAGMVPDNNFVHDMTPSIPAISETQELQLTPSNGNTLIEQIESFLQAKWLFRYNVVSHKVEFQTKDVPDSSFIEMRDFDYNSILRDLKYANIQCSMSTLRMILMSEFAIEYDPYIEYITNLPQFDAQDDYIEKLADTVVTGNPDFWRRAFKKWFVAMTASWTLPESVNHTALILNGAQGIGKTTWLSNLIPLPLRRFIHTGTLNVRDKDSQIKLSECPIIIMDEFENIGHNLEALKELITKRDIYVRRAYGYCHENYIRRASFAGSINNKDFLQDVTGNRRFLCFEAKHIDYQQYAQLDRAYAQAVYLFQNGFQYWFSSDELEELEQNNAEFRAMSSEEELLMSFYEPADKTDEEAVFMTTTDILKSLIRLSGLRSLSEQKLGRILTAQFERIKRKGRYGYVVKTKKQEDTTI